jgi:glycerol-3-phosphate dehydrogenase (NAD(P)+)
MANCTVLGGGAWGTTFSGILADAGNKTTLWAREPEVVSEINTAHRNTRYLPDIDLPAAVHATTDTAEALRDADIIVVAIPSQVARKALEPLASQIPPHAIVVMLSKGVELGTDKLMSDVVAEALHLPADRIVVVSGPNLAREIAKKQPAATVVASTNPEAAAMVAQACSAPYFRPYTNDDVIGVELCGAVKNVIALAVGIGVGAGYGWNTMATLVTRGLAEITRLGLKLGAKPETFAGLAGMGDMSATCMSPLSRNHTLGKHLGEGMSVEEATAATGGTAEGVKSAHSVLDLARREGVDMPITEAVVAVLDGKLPVADLGAALLNRPRKAEGV